VKLSLTGKAQYKQNRPPGTNNVGEWLVRLSEQYGINSLYRAIKVIYDNIDTKNGLLICLLVCLIICGTVLGFCMWIWAPKTMPVKDVLISRFSVMQYDQTIDFAGYFTSSISNSFSTTCYRGFTYEIIENDLYFTIIGGFVSPQHHFADFWISIYVDNLHDINKAYLTDGKETRLIYNLK
jgi:hypothetical protein